MPTKEQIEELQTKIRDIFDTANRVMFADYLRDHAIDPAIALKSTEQVREVWFREAEKTWDSVREECEFRTNEELDGTLAMFKAKEADQGESKTLMDHLREGGLHVAPAIDPFGASTKAESNENPETMGLASNDRPVRPLTQQLITAVLLDAWPGNAAVIDFGIDSTEHLGALQFAIKHGEVTPQELDAAMGNGEKLTEIAQRGQNPYRDVVFKTSWDEMRMESAEEHGHSDLKALFAEIRADEQAARVRDYGDAVAPDTEKILFGKILHGTSTPEPRQEPKAQEKSRGDEGHEM